MPICYWRAHERDIKMARTNDTEIEYAVYEIWKLVEKTDLTFEKTQYIMAATIGEQSMCPIE